MFHAIDKGETTDIPCCVYNFGTKGNEINYNTLQYLQFGCCKSSGTDLILLFKY